MKNLTGNTLYIAILLIFFLCGLTWALTGVSTMGKVQREARRCLVDNCNWEGQHYQYYGGIYGSEGPLFDKSFISQHDCYLYCVETIDEKLNW